MNQEGQQLKMMGQKVHKIRHHAAKALCTLAEVISKENINAAVREELQKSRTLRSNSLTDSIRNFNLRISTDKVISTVKDSWYLPSPFHVCPIPKNNGGVRNLYIRVNPMDRLIERMLYRKLAPLCESVASNCSYAYRPHRGMAELVQEVQGIMGTYNQVVKVDLQDFFGSLDLSLLYKTVQSTIHPDSDLGRILATFILHNRYIVPDTGNVCNMVKGVPQGSIIAPMLANLYGTPVDHVMESEKSIKYFRYADDILILGKSVQEAKYGYDLLLKALSEYKLQVNENKLYIGSLYGLDLLGIRFAEPDKLIIPEHRITAKLKEYLSKPMPKALECWQGTVAHYYRINPDMLDDDELFNIIERECTDAAMSYEFMKVVLKFRYKKKSVCDPVDVLAYSQTGVNDGATTVIAQ